MFGRTKDKKKVYSIKYVVIESGLPNITNDIPIEVIVDEPNNCINFIKGKNESTATLSIDKIIKIETSTKLGVQPKLTSKGKSQVLQTLKITYTSNDETKEINICETNYNGTNAFNLLTTLLNKQLQVDAPKHVDL